MKTTSTVEVTCWSCGTLFGLEETLNDLRRKDGKSFYCPNGHACAYGKSFAATIKELRSLVKSLEQDRDAARAEVRQLKCEVLKLKNPKTIWQILRLKP